MTPEELTASLRGRVKQDLARRLRFAIDASDDGPTASLAELLVAYNITTEEHAKQLARLVRELVKDEVLNAHMTTALVGYKSRPELEATFAKLAADPTSVSERDLNQAIDLILNDDRLITAPIKIIFANDEIRQILGIPPELTFDAYIASVKEALSSSTTYDDFVRATTITINGVFFSALTAVAVWALATVAAVVHTVALALNYAAVYAVALKAAVFTVTGDLAPTMPGGVLAPALGPVESVCVNATSSVVWVVVSEGNRFRRFPLSPGQDTRELGVPSIVGVIIGGPGNPLHVLDAGGFSISAGVYRVGQSAPNPTVITIRQYGDSYVIDANDSQRRAEDSGTGGVMVFDGNSDDALPRISMDTVAAAVPAGFDYASTLRAARASQRFYRTMQFVDALQGWRKI